MLDGRKCCCSAIVDCVALRTGLQTAVVETLVFG